MSIVMLEKYGEEAMDVVLENPSTHETMKITSVAWGLMQEVNEYCAECGGAWFDVNWDSYNQKYECANCGAIDPEKRIETSDPYVTTKENGQLTVERSIQ